MIKIQNLQHIPLHTIDVNIKDAKSFDLQIKRWIKELAAVNFPYVPFNPFENMSQEFHSYEKTELKIALEYCEYNLRAAQSFLRSSSKSNVRKKLKAFCVDSDGQSTNDSGDMMINMKMSIDDYKFAGESNAKINTEPNQSEETKVVEGSMLEELPLGFPLFDKMTYELLFSVFDFLDPFSLEKAAWTCKFANKVSMNPLLYKKFCVALYSFPPRLPEDSAFRATVNAINNSGYGEFTHQFIQLANENFRSFVWLPDVKHYHLNRNFFKQFKDYRSVFMQAPRLSYIGVYVMKGRYLRNGEKDLSGFYAPFHVVEYFRYIRFLPDGSVMHCMSVKKLKREFYEKLFSIKKLDELDETSLFKNGIKESMMRGEHILQGDKLHIRLASKKVLYEYKLSILNEGPAQFTLKMDEYSLRYVEKDTAQRLPMDTQGSKTFKFIRIPQYKEELEESALKYTTA